MNRFIDYANRKPKPVNYGHYLHIRIDDTMNERLEKAKEQLDEEKSALVRQAIELFLNSLNIE